MRLRLSSERTRLYFCLQCGALVSCVRKRRRNPGRKCKPERCIDFGKCRLRAIYGNYDLVEEKIDSPKGYRSFHKKIWVIYKICH